MKSKITIKNVVSYIVGSLRYKLYYSKHYKLIRSHIREQINIRMQVMDEQCRRQGSCKICGCKTTALQMANKTCPKPCYPKMMTKREWKVFEKVVSDRRFNDFIEKIRKREKIKI